MMIKCLHGYFIFEESGVGEISRFASLYGLDIVRVGNRFTFADLAEAPDFSIKGKPFLTAGPATADFAGEPWEVFEANGFVYDYDKGLVVPIATITTVLTLNQAGSFYFTDGLIKPGSITPAGKRVESYVGWFSDTRLRFRYSEVTFAE